MQSWSLTLRERWVRLSEQGAGKNTWTGESGNNTSMTKTAYGVASQFIAFTKLKRKWISNQNLNHRLRRRRKCDINGTNNKENKLWEYGLTPYGPKYYPVSASLKREINFRSSCKAYQPMIFSAVRSYFMSYYVGFFCSIVFERWWTGSLSDRVYHKNIRRWKEKWSWRDVPTWCNNYDLFS